MTTALAPRTNLPASVAGSAAGASGGLTLEQLVSGVWEGLAARSPVACPVCSGVLRPLPGGASCAHCGSRLS